MKSIPQIDVHAKLQANYDALIDMANVFYKRSKHKSEIGLQTWWQGQSEGMTAAANFVYNTALGMGIILQTSQTDKQLEVEKEREDEYRAGLDGSDAKLIYHEA